MFGSRPHLSEELLHNCSAFFYDFTFSFLVGTAFSVCVTASWSWSFTLGNQLFSISSILRMMLIYFSLKNKKEGEEDRERIQLLNQSYTNLCNLPIILPSSSPKSHFTIKLTQEICNLLQRVHSHSLSGGCAPRVRGGEIVLSTFLTCFELTRGTMYNSSARL